MEEGTSFQDNNKVVLQCHVAQRCKENLVISSKEIQVFPAAASMCVPSELILCTTEPVIHVSKLNLQESVVFYTVLETEFNEVVQRPYTFIEPVVLCRELDVETAASCVLGGKFRVTRHSPGTAVNRSVDSDKVHMHANAKTRSVRENPDLSQGGGHWGILETAKAEEKIIQNRKKFWPKPKTANKTVRKLIQ